MSKKIASILLCLLVIGCTGAPMTQHDRIERKLAKFHGLSMDEVTLKLGVPIRKVETSQGTLVEWDRGGQSYKTGSVGTTYYGVRLSSSNTVGGGCIIKLLFDNDQVVDWAWDGYAAACNM